MKKHNGIWANGLLTKQRDGSWPSPLGINLYSLNVAIQKGCSRSILLHWQTHTNHILPVSTISHCQVSPNYNSRWSKSFNINIHLLCCFTSNYLNKMLHWHSDLRYLLSINIKIVYIVKLVKNLPFQVNIFPSISRYKNLSSINMSIGTL